MLSPSLSGGPASSISCVHFEVLVSVVEEFEAVRGFRHSETSGDGVINVWVGTCRQAVGCKL